MWNILRFTRSTKDAHERPDGVGKQNEPFQPRPRPHAHPHPSPSTLAEQRSCFSVDFHTSIIDRFRIRWNPLKLDHIYLKKLKFFDDDTDIILDHSENSLVYLCLDPMIANYYCFIKFTIVKCLAFIRILYYLLTHLPSFMFCNFFLYNSKDLILYHLSSID
jgi:hypothetical protein